ncbi:MAG: GlsB/YeaQ/YmgE family stress response membrane protein [Thiotrichaceae bacterium]|uniref:GlsB/YeaQ/YmgE family stress response membrane protein n=1 Tax=Candidatus Thiocaldithrix dubininis TaxID=3080823 RepID=A0AA95H6F9_9GAMM|nr:MAG: GlsB/YeaQ/YmgE family stress response membrane protein [Candidatus Thiocaldithrix dubininis]
MDIIQILIMLAISVIAGWLAGKIVGDQSFGFWGDAAVGLVGVVIGTLLGGLASSNGFQLPGPLWVSYIFWSTIGAVIMLLVVKFVRPKPKTKTS